MAEELTPEAPAVPAPPTATQLEQQAKLSLGKHKPRFYFVYGLLGGALAVAIALVVIYAGRAITPGPRWSAWHPSGGGLGAAKQIGDEVGKAYRLPNGDQLVDVIAKAPSVSPASNQSIPIHYVAVRGSASQGDQIAVVSSSNSVMYQLCGLGASCSIASGKASVARGTLVLYTFKYVGGIKSVIALMPPPAGTQPQYVIYLQKSDVSAELKQPLDKTLGSKVPLPAAIPAREVHVIDSVTEPRVYKFGFSQAQTGDAILVLTPLPA
jgi:hypothetical protein